MIISHGEAISEVIEDGVTISLLFSKEMGNLQVAKTAVWILAKATAHNFERPEHIVLPRWRFANRNGKPILARIEFERALKKPIGP